MAALDRKGEAARDYCGVLRTERARARERERDYCASIMHTLHEMSAEGGGWRRKMRDDRLDSLDEHRLV